MGSAIMAGCHAKDPDLAENNEHVLYSRSAYERGQREAQADIQAGRLVLENWGFPRKGEQEFAEILLQRYGVELRRVASDVVEPTDTGQIFGYNNVSRPEIERRFGGGVIEKAAAEAAEHYDAQHPQ
jgi:hypothetical protein